MKDIKLTSLSNNDKKEYNNLLKDFYIPYRNSLNLNKDVTFGCEIEFNINGYEENDDDILGLVANEFMRNIGYNFPWKVTSEIDDRIEIITSVLSDKEKNWQELKNVLQFLTENGAYYKGKGGSHVHVGGQIILDDFDLFTLFLKLYACYENEIIRFTNGEYYYDRKQFTFMCARVKEIVFEMLDKKDFKKKMNVSKLLTTKTRSINFPSTDFFTTTKIGKNPFLYNKFNTIEFRSPSLTLNPIIWQNNINLFTKLLLSVKKEDFDKELLEYRYNKEKKQFIYNKKYYDDKAYELCDLVFDNEFDKKCFLRQYYKDFNNHKDKSFTLKSKPFYK